MKFRVFCEERWSNVFCRGLIPCEKNDNQRLEQFFFHVSTFPHEILPKSIATDHRKMNPNWSICNIKMFGIEMSNWVYWKHFH